MPRIGLVAKNRACSELALKMKNVIQAKAKEKQQGGQGGILLSQKSDEANGMRTDEELSKLAGVSRDKFGKCAKCANFKSGKWSK